MSFVFTGAQLCFISFMTVHLTQSAGFDLVAAGWTLAAYQAAALVSRPLLGYVADRFVAPMRLLAALGFLMCVAAALSALFLAHLAGRRVAGRLHGGGLQRIRLHRPRLCRIRAPRRRRAHAGDGAGLGRHVRGRARPAALVRPRRDGDAGFLAALHGARGRHARSEHHDLARGAGLSLQAAPNPAKIAVDVEGESMNALLLLLLVLWCALGLVVAGAFVARGADVALGEPATLTTGARLLLLPGAFLLWPLVLWRWLRAASAS